MNHLEGSFVILMLCAFLCAGCSTPEQVAETAPPDDGLFPAPENQTTGFLQVSELHSMYYATSGNPDGTPVICLHGGPGVGSYPRLARYFNPEKFFVVLYDQRGAGKSKPFGELRENTTPELVEDIEKLREHLGLDRFLLFGGSWGTTLGLAYAEKYPERVIGMVLRGVFLGSEEEIRFHYLTTGYFFPQEQDRLLKVLPDPTRGTDPDYLYELITGEDTEQAKEVMAKLHRFEFKFMALHLPDQVIENFLSTIPEDAALLSTRLDLHYVHNRYFMEKDQLLNNLDRIEDIPATLIVGRYDMASPPFAAFAVHKGLPDSKLVIVEEAGHSEREEGITAAILTAVAEFEN